MLRLLVGGFVLLCFNCLVLFRFSGLDFSSLYFAVDILFIYFDVLMKILESELRVFMDHGTGGGGVKGIMLEFCIKLTSNAIGSVPGRPHLAVGVGFFYPRAGPVAENYGPGVVVEQLQR